MSFLIQRIDGARITLQQVKGQTLLIGRGTNAALRSDNPAVAIEHAVIDSSPEGFVLTDRGSITGTYVNGQSVETVRLSKGDQIYIGDLKLVIQSADPGKPMVIRYELESSPQPRRAPSAAAVEVDPRDQQARGGELRAKRIDFARAYSLDRKLLTRKSLTIGLLFVVTVIVGSIFVRGKEAVFMPGPISVSHASVVLPDGSRMIHPDNCSACHTPFQGVTDAKCIGCHKQSFHQVSEQELGSCVSCHTEHRQLPAIATVRNEQCVSCHTGPLTAINVGRFGTDHPEFTVRLLRSRPVGPSDDPEVVRISLDSDEIRTADPARIKFNHECHMLGGTIDPSGRPIKDCTTRPPTAADPRNVKEDLTCESCHTVNPSSGLIQPLSYDQACERCHRLTFDNRFPPVPHRLELGTIAGVIANAYAGNQELLSLPPEAVLRIFSERKAQPVNLSSATVQNAQRVLRVRCVQCHYINEATGRVVPPDISYHWFAATIPFKHSTHLSEGLQTTCLDCHHKIETSRVTADLSLPGIESCVGCHSQESSFAQRSLHHCGTCHYYHHSTVISGEKWAARDTGAMLASVSGGDGFTNQFSEATERMKSALMPADLTWIALTVGAIVGAVAIFIFFVVVLVIRRNSKRKKKAAAGARPRSAGTAAPRMEPPPAAPAPAAPSPTPSAPPPPQPATEFVPVAQMSGAAAPEEPVGATMMIQWFGSLVGVEGALKGRRLPIGEDGFWIGRDSQLSRVVIDDSRISRRHVWIGVRDGKPVAMDQESTNGTFLNKPDNRITETVLSKGDRLILGDNAAIFEYIP